MSRRLRRLNSRISGRSS